MHLFLCIMLLTLCRSNLNTCPYIQHIYMTQRKHNPCRSSWLNPCPPADKACEDREALQQVFTGYNGSIWQRFFLCLREMAEWCFEEFGEEPAVYEKKQNWLEAALGEDCFPEKHSILFGWGDCVLVLSRVVFANRGRVVCLSTSLEHLTVDRSG